MSVTRLDHLAGRSLSRPLGDARLRMYRREDPPAANWPRPGDEPEIKRCVLDNRPIASRMAREFIHKTLLRHGLHDLVADLEMAASELVTNALTHGTAARPKPAGGRRPVQLVLVRHRRRVLITVTDPSSTAPVMGEPDPLAEGGRGLHVVQALSLSWGWAPLATGGKAVWAIFATQSPSRSEGDPGLQD